LIVAIPPEQIEDIWVKVSPMLEKALNKNPGDLDIDDVRDKMFSGEYLLMCAVEGEDILASFAVEIFSEKRKKANIVLCGGEQIDEWLTPFMNVIKPLVKEQGCDVLTIMGRKGWERKMKPFGFCETARILEVNL